METFIVVVFIGMFLISVFINVFIYVAWKNIRKKEQSRLKRLDREGAPVFATVTRVLHNKGQRKFVIQAQWLSRETRKTYYFQEEFRFLRGALRFRPKIQKGDIVRVNVLFDEFLYCIKRKQ